MKKYIFTARFVVLLGALSSSFFLRPAAESAATAAAAVEAAVVENDSEQQMLEEQLLDAVKKEDLARVNQLIAQGAPVGQTPLIVAARKAFPDLVSVLLRASAEAKRSEKFTETLLIGAILLKNVEDARKLSYEISDRLEVLSMLLKEIGNLEDRGCEQTIWIDLLGHWNNVAGHVNRCNQGQITRYYVNVSHMLLEAGAMIDAVDKTGDTLLMRSLMGTLNSKSQGEMVEMLIITGANLDIKNNRGETVFDYLQNMHPQEEAFFRRAIAERDRIRAIKREAVSPHMQKINPLVDIVLEYEGR